MTETLTTRRLGLAPLSLLGAEPWGLVKAAGEAGFSFVGLRVRSVTPTETFHDLTPGSANARRTLDALAATGLTVEDVEFLILDGTIGHDDWMPALDAGANLGARTITVAASDTDRTRLIDTLAGLAADARPLGITPTLEPIAYQAVRTLPDAAEIARAAGCLVLPDALHYLRVGATPADARAAADLASLVQLCDAPAQHPTDRDGLLHESRAERALPGQGDVDLAGFLGAFPDGLPVSVEVPNPLRNRIGDVAYVRALMETAREVLAR